MQANRQRARGRRLGLFVALAGWAVSAVVACGDTLVFMAVPGEGADASGGARGSAAEDGATPSDVPSSSDAAGSGDADDIPDAQAGPGPAPPGFVQCGDASCDLQESHCFGSHEGVRLCRPLDSGVLFVERLVACETKSDCPLEGGIGPYFCKVIGQGGINGSPSVLSARCLEGNVGLPQIEPAKPGFPPKFRILTCDPNPAPPMPSCSNGVPCTRQTCSGFVFDLCGEIPDGGCDPI